jgi:hypothetical protein
VTVGEYRDVARRHSSLADHAVDAAAHVLGALPARSSVREQEPAGISTDVSPSYSP